MPRYRKQSKVSLSAEHKEQLERLAKSSKFDQKTIIEYLIDLHVKYDLMDVGWEDRLKDADKKREVYTRLDGACKAMTYAGEFYICVFGHANKPPTIKKLSKELHEALDICASADCEARLEMKIKNEEYQTQIRVLETRLETRSTEKFKIPVCQQGAVLSSDVLSFNGCPKNQGKAVSVKEYCQKLRGGQGCAVYVERVLGVGEKV